MRIGVLAVQGAFIEHESMLEKLGASVFEIRKAEDLSEDFDGLVIPGGESTVIGRLVRELGMYDILRQKIKSGLPVFGTCAGLIMLAGEIENDERRHFATMDICVVRNAYGRQLGSFEASGDFGGLGEVPMRFIRAPYIKKVSENVKVLSMCDGRIVAARQENQLVTAFHPELTESPVIHSYFINMVKKYMKSV